MYDTGDINILQNKTYIYNKNGDLLDLGYDKEGHPINPFTGATAQLDGDRNFNDKVDKYILRHITYNMPNTTGTVGLSTVAAIVLAPKAKEVKQTNGAGWIITGSNKTGWNGSEFTTGVVYSDSELHFYYQGRGYKASAKETLKVEKNFYKQGTTLEADQKTNKTFTFQMYNSNKKWQQLSARGEASVGKAGDVIEFDSFEYDETNFDRLNEDREEKNFYYIIKNVFHIYLPFD